MREWKEEQHLLSSKAKVNKELGTYNNKRSIIINGCFYKEEKWQVMCIQWLPKGLFLST